VTLGECKLLSDTLRMVTSGSSFLPGPCVAMLKHNEVLETRREEAQNAEVYERVSHRGESLPVLDIIGLS
jgi:hypothetical protein